MNFDDPWILAMVAVVLIGLGDQVTDVFEAKRRDRERKASMDRIAEKLRLLLRKQP